MLGEVRAAVEDWPAMLERTAALRDALDSAAGTVPSEDIAEATALLDWLMDGNYIFLGFREYELTRTDSAADLVPVEGTGLGILRGTRGSAPSEAFSRLPPRVKTIAHIPRALTITKANALSRVHRPVRLDYIGVKRFDSNGLVIGERRLLGLLTGHAYKAPFADVPIVRRKARQVLARAAFPPGGHDEKALLDVLETYPREELFQMDVNTLFQHAMGIVWLGERQLVRVFPRLDEFERFVSFLVFLPRERFNTENRHEGPGDPARCGRRGGARTSRCGSRESVLVRLHIVISTQPGQLPELDVWDIEQRIADATRSWTDDLRLALRGGPGEEGADDWRRYATRSRWCTAPTTRSTRRSATSARSTTSTAQRRAGGPAVALADGLRCRVFTGRRRSSSRRSSRSSSTWACASPTSGRTRSRRPAPRSRTSRTSAGCGRGRRDRRRRAPGVRGRALARAHRPARERPRSTASSSARACAGATRSCCAPSPATCARRGTTFSDRYLMSTLLAHPDIAALLVELFEARLDPRARATPPAPRSSTRGSSRRSRPSRASTRTGS